MTSDTHHRIAKFISSQQMGCFETQEKVINLGRLLIDELGSEPRVDSLSKWMANYISEKMISSESLDGHEKTEIDKECFDAILMLWAHHSSYPSDKRPFGRFEPIFNALQSLDPDNSHPHHQSLYWTQDDSNDGLELSQDKDIREWINIALNIDAASKVFVEFSLRQAVESAMDEKTNEWLKNAIGLPDDEEISIILNFSSKDLNESERFEKERERERALGRLTDRMNKLDAFEGLCHQLREAYSNEIDRLSNDKSYDEGSD